MGVYDTRPWLSSYREGLPDDLAPEHPTMLEAFAASVARAPDRVAVHYFDGALTVAEVDDLTDALASALLGRGFRAGDRVAVYLQNVPQFVLAVLAAWKAGGAAVPVNPMNRARELAYVLEDSGATVLVCHESLYGEVAASVVPGTDVGLVVTTSELEFQSRDDARVLAASSRVRHDGTEDLLALADAHRGERPPPARLSAADVALLTYTSGTTGRPKGAMNTHGNVVFNSRTYRDWIGLGAQDSVLGVAPLFHITGLVGHLGLCLLLPAPLVLTYRFEPGVVADAVREHRATFTIGAITVFVALMNHAGVTREDLASFRAVYSGGAPIPPSVVEAFRSRFGHYIHNAYGLTETSSPSHLGPFGVEAPVDDESGALSVGVPVFGTVVRVVGDDGQELPAGQVGEFETEGPQVVPGYWDKPEETAQGLPGGRLRTGDVGFMDERGWFFLVDRKKDMINAAGYKVWPREVEDVLYGHPAVREAAVVGVPDEYRGETVRAYVSLKPGADASPDDVVAFCKERMAAYKYPRQVRVLEELPKTVTGKILRRELRARAREA